MKRTKSRNTSNKTHLSVSFSLIVRGTLVVILVRIYQHDPLMLELESFAFRSEIVQIGLLFLHNGTANFYKNKNFTQIIDTVDN